MHAEIIKLKPTDVEDVGLEKLVSVKLPGASVLSGRHLNYDNTFLYLAGGFEVHPQAGIKLKLFRKDPVSGEKMGGYLEANGKVKTIKFRDQYSEGILIELSKVEELLEDKLNPTAPLIQQGEIFYLQGEKASYALGEKYKSRATRQWQSEQKQGIPGLKKMPVIPEHYDTPHYFRVLRGIDKPFEFIVTTKLHGTSGRTGKVQIEIEKPVVGWKKAINFFADIFCGGPVFLPKKQYEHRWVTGTRRTMNPKESWRIKVAEFIKAKAHDAVAGTTFYYEIVGWSGAKAIQSIGKEKFHYGVPLGAVDFYIYEIRVHGQSMSWDKMVAYCDRIGLKTVPLLLRQHVTPDTFEAFNEKIKAVASQKEGAGHIREGVCICVASSPDILGPYSQSRWMKYKSPEFMSAETASDQDDPEDLS